MVREVDEQAVLVRVALDNDCSQMFDVDAKFASRLVFDVAKEKFIINTREREVK